MANDWKRDLADFFAQIEREDRAFSENVERKQRFYAAVARPALEAAKNELARHGRDCEAGADHDRVYLIVRKNKKEVEFQYAIVAETTIESVTPYSHCWFESLNEADENQHSESDEQDADQETDGDDASDDSAAEENGDETKPDEPPRIKTIELLRGWTAERQIEDVSQTEVIADFLSYYKEAVNNLRSRLHQ